MSCGCGRLKGRAKDMKKEQVLALARREHRGTGRVIVFFRCTDYDFTTLDKFEPNGKRVIEYIL